MKVDNEVLKDQIFLLKNDLAVKKNQIKEFELNIESFDRKIIEISKINVN